MWYVIGFGLVLMAIHNPKLLAVLIFIPILGFCAYVMDDSQCRTNTYRAQHNIPKTQDLTHEQVQDLANVTCNPAYD